MDIWQTCIRFYAYPGRKLLNILSQRKKYMEGSCTEVRNTFNTNILAPKIFCLSVWWDRESGQTNIVPGRQSIPNLFGQQTDRINAVLTCILKHVLSSSTDAMTSSSTNGKACERGVDVIVVQWTTSPLLENCDNRLRDKQIVTEISPQ
jgi:hypothetical protein